MTERAHPAVASLPLTALAVRSLRRRLVLLGGLGALFLVAALTARAVAGHGEHIEPDALFQLGGYPLVSGLLLLGWSIGRFPIVAVLVLAAGLFSADVASGQARLFATRSGSIRWIYALRLTAACAIAFGVSAVLLPAFDLILLGQWAGPATLVLILSYVIAYGGLVAFLSVWTRADAWLAFGLAILSILWATLRRAGRLDAAPGVVRDVITFVLPPQDAFFALENAFAGVQPVPWDALAFAVGYGVVFLGLAVAFLGWREI